MGAWTMRVGAIAAVAAICAAQSDHCVGPNAWGAAPEALSGACSWNKMNFMTYDEAVEVCEKKQPGGSWGLPTVDQANALLTQLTGEEQVKWFPLSPTAAKVCNPGDEASGPNCNEWVLGAGQWGGFNTIQCDSKVCQAASDEGSLNYLVRCVQNNSASCAAPNPPPPPPTPEIGYWCVNSTACLHGPRPGPGYPGGTEAECKALCRPHKYHCREGKCVVAVTGGTLKECTDVC
eukprot:m.106810 g.106810  ORF g.106810 m.106810 type:complete len:234 (+) comp21113_c0_seq1:55-756(+)